MHQSKCYYIWNLKFEIFDFILTCRIAQRYAAGCTGRKKQIVIQEGSEPISFRGFFQAWQEDYDPNAKFDSMTKE